MMIDRQAAYRLSSAHYARAKLVNGGKPNGFWTADQWLWLCARVGGRCVYCGHVTPRLTPDHLQPLALGGTNAFTNIAPVCLDCNRRKGATPVWEYFSAKEYERLLAWLHPVRETVSAEHRVSSLVGE